MRSSDDKNSLDGTIRSILSINETNISQNDVDAEHGIHRAIHLFTWIRQNDIGIIFISSKDLTYLETLFNNKYSCFIIGSIDKKEDKNLIKLTVKNVSLFVDLLKDFMLDEDLFIVYQREKIRVFSFHQCIYTKHGFNTPDYVMWRSLSNEKITDILKADLLERMSKEVGVSEIYPLLKSRFIQSLDENINFPIVYNHPLYRIKNQQELCQVMISKVKNSNQLFWNMPFRTALLYDMLKGKKDEH